MNISLLKSKRTRGKVFAAIAVVIVALIVALNFLLTYLGIHEAFFADLTPEGLYTLSDAMIEECSFIDEPSVKEGGALKIIFCSDPDTLIDDTVTRAPYFTAVELDNKFENVELETVNVTYNPTAVSKYKTTSLSSISPTDIIISYGSRYRIVNAQNFWVASNNKLWSYNGEYKLASIILSLTAKERPVAYFTTGHGETYYDTAAPDSEGSIATAYLYDLLTERGLEVRTVDLEKAGAVPEDCVLLIVNNPTSDFKCDVDKLDEYGYVSETEMLDRYLVTSQGAIMVAKDYEATGLDNLTAFLREWGMSFGESLVKDTSSYVPTESGDYTTLVGEYDKDEDSYGYAIYGDFAALESSPEMIFSNTGYMDCSFAGGWSTPEPGTYSASRNYAPFFYSSKEAKAYAKNELVGDYVDLEREYEGMHLSAVTTRMEIDSYTAEYKYSYLFCQNSKDAFSNETLGNASYANYDVFSALVDNMARIDEYASSMLGGTSFNIDNLGGKQLIYPEMSETAVFEYDDKVGAEVLKHHAFGAGTAITYAVIILALPVIAAIVGMIVVIKRRFL